MCFLNNQPKYFNTLYNIKNLLSKKNMLKVHFIFRILIKLKAIQYKYAVLTYKRSLSALKSNKSAKSE